MHATSCGLTLPSRGRATSGFASCRPPLMSNVRPRNAMPRTMSAFVHRPAANEKLGSQHCRASSPWPWLRRAIRPLAAGEPSSLDRRSNSFPLAPPRTRAPGTNAFRSPATLQALARVNVWSVHGRRCSGAGEVGALAVTMVLSSAFGSRCRGISNSRASPARPNPSIEGTSQRPLRALCAAPHVKR